MRRSEKCQGKHKDDKLLLESFLRAALFECLGVDAALSPPGDHSSHGPGRGGGGGVWAQGPKLGWDRREMHSHPENGLFPRSNLAPKQ